MGVITPKLGVTALTARGPDQRGAKKPIQNDNDLTCWEHQGTQKLKHLSAVVWDGAQGSPWNRLYSQGNTLARNSLGEADLGAA